MGTPKYIQIENALRSEIESGRVFEGVPYQLQVSYIPRRFIKQDVDPSYYESVYRRLREDCGLFLSREAAREVMRIVMPAEEAH